MMSNFLSIETRSGVMDVYAASVEGLTPKPVVIVIMEAFGVNKHIQDVCQRLAKEGFYALAPDLYHRSGRKITVEYGDKKFLDYMSELTNKAVVDDIRETMTFLENIRGADSQNIFVMGFCVGGFSTMLAATKLPIQGAISFYGAGMVREREMFQLKPIVNDLAQIKCPTLLFFGDKDESIPQNDIQAVETILKENNQDFEIVIYPDSEHGFFCDQRKSFNHSAASKAWKKSLEALKMWTK